MSCRAVETRLLSGLLMLRCQNGNLLCCVALFSRSDSSSRLLLFDRLSARFRESQRARSLEDPYAARLQEWHAAVQVPISCHFGAVAL